MMKRALFLAALVACGGKNPPPQQPDIGPQKPDDIAKPDIKQPEPPRPANDSLAMWPEVKKGTLPNGLTYYVLKNKKPEKRAMLWLAVNAGSVQEDDDQRGLAHFVEHMAFNGTKKYPKHAIINYIESVGLRFGADLNAYTSWDETVYTLEVPTDDAAIVGKGLEVLREWSGNVVFEPKEVDDERGVVLEEWRLGLGAGRRLFDKHVKVIFKGSRYADRITIGLSETLKNAPRDALVRYYKDWYRPDLMAVIAVGDFDDTAAIEREITAKFGDLAKPAKPRPRPRGEVPKPDGTRVSIETDKEQTVQTVSVANQFAHRAESTKADLRRQIAEGIYTQMFNERFRTLGRKADSPFTGAFASIGGNTREIDQFSRGATVKGGRVEDSLRALFTEVVRVEQHGFTQGELDRARVSIARRMEQSIADAPTAQSRPYAQELVRNFFENEFVVGPIVESELTLKILPEITLAELNQLAKTYGGAENRVITISGPDGQPLPTRDRILAIIDEVGKSKPDAWVDKAPPTTLMATAPKAGTIKKETANAKLGTTEWTLSNGVRVIVKPTDFEADSVRLSGSSPGGLGVATAAQYPHARFADTIAGIGGVAELDTEDLAKVLVGKQAGASVSIGEVTESVSGRASKRDLETMFQLVYLRMTAPRRDDAQIAVWRENLTQSLTERQRSPDWKFGNASNEVLWNKHPRRAQLMPEDVKKVDVEKALAFYKDRFGDATDFTFVIVGTVDAAALKPLVETYLASLPAKGRREKEKDSGARRVGGVVKKAWGFGQEPKARVTIQYHADEAWTREKERDMYVLNRAMSIRLREEMRESLGGVYGVQAGGFISRRPRQERVFTVGFGADPKRVDELIKAKDKVIAEVTKTGISTEILDKIKKGFERERELQLKSNGFWLDWLENSARFGDDPEMILDPKPMMARMTNDNIKASAKRFIDGKRVYQAIMLPEGSDALKKPTVQPKKDPKIVPGAERSPDTKTVPGAEKTP